MTELEKIEYAKTFIDKLANGINPLDNTPVKDDDVVNNVRLSRCFFFVSDVLRQVIENGGINKKRNGFIRFELTDEQLSGFEFSQTPIPVSEIAKRINELKSNENMKKLSHRDITNWLLSVDILREQENTYTGKKTKLPTGQGEDLGISSEKRSGQYGEYTVTLYNKSAQEFIIDNIDAILALKYNK